MKLHHNEKDFQDLINITANHFQLPADAVRKDYFITLILANLESSEYVDLVIFKGGTSLSKCYPNSIERFSEDIDLTYIPDTNSSNKIISNRLKEIERLLIGSGKSEVIPEERNERNKSCYVWFSEQSKIEDKIKLEIGSSVIPYPFSKRSLQSYIHSYLVIQGFQEVIDEFDLKVIWVNVLNIERTFIDKIFSVKRHAICGTIGKKVRHIYDVVRLSEMNEIKNFLNDKDTLKKIVSLTKETDHVYFEKRRMPSDYVPWSAYNYLSWKAKLTDDVKKNYENLHNTLLYTNQKQDWNQVDAVFSEIDRILSDIQE